MPVSPLPEGRLPTTSGMACDRPPPSTWGMLAGESVPLFAQFLRAFEG